MVLVSDIAQICQELNIHAWSLFPYKKLPETLRHTVPECQSIFIAAESYAHEYQEIQNIAHLHGSIAPYTRINYYKILEKKLKSLSKYIEIYTKQKALRISVNGAIPVKPLAALGGLGTYGKNSLIINPYLGSLFVLGAIFWNTPLPEYHGPYTLSNANSWNPCKDCNKCSKACPTQALEYPYKVLNNLCLQALCNVEKVFDSSILRVWGKRFYGCDTCQRVCPWNQNAHAFSPPDPPIGYVGSSIFLPTILEIDEESYRKTFAHNQLSARWIHFSCMQRNALVGIYLQDQDFFFSLRNNIHIQNTPLIHEQFHFLAKLNAHKLEILKTNQP